MRSALLSFRPRLSAARRSVLFVQDRFRRVRHYFWHQEWEIWDLRGRASPGVRELAEPAQKRLPPIHPAGLIELVSEETDVLPGGAPAACSWAHGARHHLTP